MKIKKTEFPGLVEIIPNQHADSRGFFFEAYNQGLFYENYLPTKFVQDNESYSNEGVLRGLHFQKPPFAQGKLVRVILGRVLDVVVDLRKGSPTYLKSYSTVLDSNQKKMLYVPEGFAHGFLALSDVVFHYKCTGFYHKEAECGIKWDDPELDIDWYGDCHKHVSEKDQQLLSLGDAVEQIEASADSNGQFIFSQ